MAAAAWDSQDDPPMWDSEASTGGVGAGTETGVVGQGQELPGPPHGRAAPAPPAPGPPSSTPPFIRLATFMRHHPDFLRTCTRVIDSSMHVQWDGGEGGRSLFLKPAKVLLSGEACCDAAGAVILCDIRHLV